jgi:integrase
MVARKSKYSVLIAVDSATGLLSLPVADQPLKDIIVLMRDMGMRNARELYRMRVENIDWNSRVIFNPNSKTQEGRRFIPMSDRVMNILMVRRADRTEGWVFPSRQKGKHITGGLVNKQWVRARKKAGLPEDLVLDCARHDFWHARAAERAISPQS